MLTEAARSAARTSPGQSAETSPDRVMPADHAGPATVTTSATTQRRSTGAAQASAAIRRTLESDSVTRDSSSSPAPVIAAPSSSGVTVRRVDVGDEPAAQDHLERVGQADQLVEVGGDQQHGQARRAGRRGCWSQIAAWAPTSTPRVGCAAISSLGLAAHLAADDQLLLVAAGQRADGGDVDAGRADVELARRSARCRPGRRARSMQRARGVGRARSGGRGSGSPRAAPRAAGRAGAGPRGCSRCRPRGARRVCQCGDVGVAERDRRPASGRACP